MTELQRHPVPGQNFGPVSLCLVNRTEGGQAVAVAGVEAAFEEYSPDSRANRFVWGVKVALALVSLPFAICLVLVGPFFVASWLDGDPVKPDQVVYFGSWVLGALILCFAWARWRPPFKGPVRVFMSPGDDRVSIYRHGKLAETATLSQVRGVGLEPHPKLEEAVVAAEADPKRSTNRALINRYKLTQVLYLYIGVGATVMKVEVAAFRVSGASNLPMQARAAVDLGREMAIQLAGKGPIQPATAVPEMEMPQPVQAPAKRRRRSRVE